MKKYSLVFLDADDTLFDYTRAEKYALVETLAQYGIPAEQKLFERYSEINNQYWRMFERGEISQTKLRSERFSLLFTEAGINCAGQQFSEDYLRSLSEASFLLEDAISICAYLNEKYITAIITNGIRHVQFNRLERSGLMPHIRHVIVSEEAGTNKPDPDIFLYAEKQTGIKNRNEMIIIGDSLSSDIQGGFNYGIDTCWFNAKRTQNTTGLVPAYEIHSLAEIKTIL
ncbi:YjjG family noncanonical pyrimidine nucleotidase [Brucepastera parasyntrophica]|uniref:YjjG family noncanonical pyrimidine nucleotidase n=1 Tax=Brucepastera parasyntrophica TaxID=2880008 RepID=UPI0021089A48|nr:YjjG family noncanonical pyrimidine nucleotidase [Brucepastera parasyntrophica]ULQ58786.1 YjjG family noncanonical pyrimidine nucleotidase [Brucepastera parasyntrophica]